MIDRHHIVSVPFPAFSAVYVDAGTVRRIWFESACDEAARAFCVRHGFGLEGPAARPSDSLPPPAFYNEKSARTLLGGISRTSLYRELIRGNLIRVPGMRKILITRQSIENWRR